MTDEQWRDARLRFAELVRFFPKGKKKRERIEFLLHDLGIITSRDQSWYLVNALRDAFADSGKKP